jgi:putative salt-induced outer membrane protein YdiY
MCGTGRGLLAVLSLLWLCLPAYAQEGEADGKKWTGSVNFGATLTTGTTDSFSGNAQADAERAWESDTLKFGLDAIYGRADGEDNANNQAVTTNWRHDFTERLFSYAEVELGRDTIQLIQWQLITSAGPGWRAWQAGEKRYLDLEVGVGYRHQEFLDPGRPNTKEPNRNEVLTRAAFEHTNMIGESFEIKWTGEFLLPGNDTKAFFARSELMGSVPLVAGWFFRTSFGVEYQNEPAEGAEEVNTTLATGLEYRF